MIYEQPMRQPILSYVLHTHTKKLIFFINLDFYAHPIKERIIYVHIKFFRFNY